MSQVAVILGVDDEFGSSLFRQFESLGWKVFGLTPEPAGGVLGRTASDPDNGDGGLRSVAVDLSSIGSMEAAASQVSAAVDHVDILICNVHSDVDSSRLELFDFDAMRRAHDLNGLASLRFVEAFLPLTTRGMKRICFVTGPEAVVGDRQASEVGIGVRMSRATVHTAATIISNDLRRDGYSVRLYIPGAGVEKAVDYLIDDVDDQRPRIFDPSGKEWGF